MNSTRHSDTTSFQRLHMLEIRLSCPGPVLSLIAARLICTVAILCAGCTFPAAPPTPGSVQVKISAFNDFHGHLEPPGIAVAAPGGDGKDSVLVKAYWETLLQMPSLRLPRGQRTEAHKSPS